MEVMIVDDSSFMLNVLENVLSEMDIDNIITATDGNEAVDKYRQERPDLVLMDIVMDEMGGEEALRQIKDIDSDAKVLMISAVGQEEKVEETMAQGAEGFMKKPFENQKVREKIRNMMDED